MLDLPQQVNLLDIHGVCRSFPKGSGEELLVLEKVDLTIRSGEIVGPIEHYVSSIEESVEP